MCGILFELIYHGCSVKSILEDEKVLKRLKNRGPNSLTTKKFISSSGIKISACGAVLWMRGFGLTAQPLENAQGVLLYNGDIYGDTLDINDTHLIMKILSQDNSTALQKIEKLKSLKGPFSIMFYDKVNEELYFVRDRFGRNSLLFCKNSHSVVISSVLGREYKCIEIPAQYIHIWNLKTNTIKAYSWQNYCDVQEVSVDDWFDTVKEIQSLPDEQFTFQYDVISLENYNEDNIVQFINSTDTKCKLNFMETLIKNKNIQETVLAITELLENSVKKRVEAQPFKCKNCLFQQVVCKHSTVGILFSGGLDCTILAFLANKFVPAYQSIELLNVAFKKENTSYDVPDRLTGRQSFEELKKLCPSRQWTFKEINIPKEELEELQRSTIADLVHPRQTILDESLGSALWFAARGKDDSSVSNCRILLLGSGADELFGGYTRHRNAFRRHGWPGLDKELQLDWKRISFRNLARDDRVVCDHGRQSRLPYLDEDFTEYVLKLKPWLRCFPSDSLPHGVGDKLMLRLVAFKLGLTEVAKFPKRALQFGSRIANKKEKGSDISKSFLLEQRINL